MSRGGRNLGVGCSMGGQGLRYGIKWCSWYNILGGPWLLKLIAMDQKPSHVTLLCLKLPFWTH